MVDGLRPARVSELKAGMTIVAREVGDCLPDGMHTVCRAPEGFFVPCGSGRHMLDTVLEGGDTLAGFWIAPDLPVPQDGILAAWLDAAGDPGGAPPETIDAVEAVLMERKRQIDAEAFLPGRDDLYTQGELARAAACYARAAADVVKNPHALYQVKNNVPADFPFPDYWWKFTTPARALEKAGALILADIERLARDARSGVAK